MPTVTWENISSNVQINGNKIRRASPTGEYWPGANLCKKVDEGTGYVEFEVKPLADPQHSSVIVGFNKNGRVNANDDYDFSLYFTQNEVFAYEFGDIGAYVGIPFESGAKFRIKMLNGTVEYQVKNSADSEFSTFVTSTLQADVCSLHTINVTLRLVNDGVHILGVAS